jgi:molecular chaperone DnaJ
MDLYIVLGIERDASDGDIKRAYKRLARRFHPDINPGDNRAAAQFRLIAEAYETLIDPDRRRRYDLTGVTVVQTETVAYGFKGFDFSASVSGADASTFGELFFDALRPGTRRQDPAAERGADLHQDVNVSFEEAWRGGQRRLTVTRQERCRTCQGSGALPVAESRCLRCHGAGTVKAARGHMVFTHACAHCGGTGYQRQARCSTCDGQQIETQTEILTVSLPPGLADQARIRIPGKGHVGRFGGEHGDLYITVHVETHPLFRREGDDLHVVVPMAIHEAALGAKIDVPTLDGLVRVRIPPGTQSGQRFHVREGGAVSARDGRRGDLVVEAKLVLPKTLDERSKELLREFGRLNGEDVRRGFVTTKDTKDTKLES